MKTFIKRILSMVTAAAVVTASGVWLPNFGGFTVITAAADTEQLGDLIVTDNNGNGCSYKAEDDKNLDGENHKLYLYDGSNVTLSGNGSRYKIVVSENCTATITLDNYTSERPYKYTWGWSHCIELEKGSFLTLILKGENNLTGGQESSAIRVPGGTSLVIEGDGVLNASVNNYSSAAYCAVIGSQYTQPYGNITINSGTVNAISKSNSSAAGIGTAYWDGSEGTENGVIELNGGIINASSIGAVQGSSDDHNIIGNGGAVINNSIIKADISDFNGIVASGSDAEIHGVATVPANSDVLNGKNVTYDENAVVPIQAILRQGLIRP